MKNTFEKDGNLDAGLFNPDCAKSSWTLLASWYTDPQIFQKEHEAVFLALPAVNRFYFLELVNTKNAIFSTISRLFVAAKGGVIILRGSIYMYSA